MILNSQDISDKETDGGASINLNVWVTFLLKVTLAVCIVLISRSVESGLLATILITVMQLVFLAIILSRITLKVSVSLKNGKRNNSENNDTKLS